MRRTFIEVPSFTEKWTAVNFSDEHLRMLENILLKDPKVGTVIPGTGGLRKVRIPLDDRGKRGGGRVIYVDIERKETIYLLQVYMKNEQTNLTMRERKLLRNMVLMLKEE